MMNKRYAKIALTLLVLIVISCGSILLATPPFFPEPTNNKDVPDDIVWNTSLGCYVRKDMAVDPVTGSIYDPKLKVDPGTKVPYDKSTDMGAWLMEHQQSNSKLDKAIQEYCTEKQKNTGDSLVMSYYSTKDDKNFHILASLSVNEVPAMLNFIEANNLEVTGVLMEAVSSITKTDNGFISVGDSDRIKWVNTLKAKAKKGVEMTNSKDGNYTMKEVEEIGIFALPYIQKMYEKGNKDILKLMPKLTNSEFAGASQEAANNDWGNWFKNHKQEIDMIITIAQ